MKKLLLVLVMVCLLAGCQSNMPSGSEDSKTPVVTEDNKKDMTSNKNSQMDNKEMDKALSVSDAVKTFVDKYPGVQIEEVSLEKDQKPYRYEISGFDKTSEYEFEVDAMDGTILKDKTEKDNTADKMAINLDLLGDIQALIDEALKEAGEGYYLESYSLEFEKIGKFNKLSIDLEKSNGSDLEFEYNLDTKELLKEDR